MKTIGLLGGMSYESTLTYYRVINEAVSEALGGLHSARCLISSIDFAELEPLQSAGRWDEAAELLLREALRLERAGADFLCLCSNTAHIAAPRIASAAGIPLLHIGEAAAGALLAANVRKAGLLGTKYTLSGSFLTDVLRCRGIEPLLPGEGEAEALNDIIFGELCRGRVEPSSKKFLLSLCGELAARGAGGIILGCTELGLAIGPTAAPVPVFDTALIHARRAAALALEA